MDYNTTKKVELPIEKVEEPAKKAEELIKKAENPVKRTLVSPQGEIPYIVVSNDGSVMSLRDARGVKTSFLTPKEYKDAQEGEIVYIKKEE